MANLNRHLTPAEIDRIGGLRRSGVPTTEIARLLGCADSTVRRRCSQLGILGPGKRRLTIEEIDRIAELREAGLPLRQIARLVGCSDGAVGWQCMRLGISGRSMPSAQANRRAAGHLPQRPGCPPLHPAGRCAGARTETLQRVERKIAEGRASA